MRRSAVELLTVAMHTSPDPKTHKLQFHSKPHYFTMVMYICMYVLSYNDSLLKLTAHCTYIHILYFIVARCKFSRMVSFCLRIRESSSLSQQGATLIESGITYCDIFSESKLSFMKIHPSQ